MQMQPSFRQPTSFPSSVIAKRRIETVRDEEQAGLVSRNVTIGTHRTSIRLEPDMWAALKDICRREHVSIHDIATVVSVRKAPQSSLTAAMRVFVMAYYRMAATEEGHNQAGHGPGGAFMRSLVAQGMGDQDSFE